MYYIWDPVSGTYPNEFRSPLTTGNYSISIIAVGTAFEKSDRKNGYSSDVFEKFKNNRGIIAQRRATALKAKDPTYSAAGDGVGGFDGYNLDAQQVIIPAFYAAYTGKDPNKVSMTDFPSLLSMLPNWDVNFDGLGNIAFLKQYFRSISLRHSYKARYAIGNYTSNFDYNGDVASAVSYMRDLQNNFIPKNDIASVFIEEVFGPLGGLDVTFNNSLSTRFEMRRSRNISMGLSNLQLTENKTSDYILGLGYTFNEVAFSIKTLSGEQKRLQSDLKVNADLSIRDSKTLIRRVGELEDLTQSQSNLPVQVSAGQNVTSLKISADYRISSSFTFTVFFDRIVNTPFVSTSYKNYNTNFGFSMRFSLVQ
jgi:cell surface protein SprA